MELLRVRWRPISILFVLALLRATMSAMVAQEKVLEMVEQVKHQLNSSVDGANLELVIGAREGGGFSTADLTEPLSLQFAVLQVTDSLIREMNLPAWQAMLRALGGDREILKRFAQLRPRFALLEAQMGQDGVEDHENLAHQLNKLGSLSPFWQKDWDRLQSLIQTIGNLHDWFDRYQRNAAVVNERTLRDFAETVHGSDGTTTAQVIESIHQIICPNSLQDEDLDGLDYARNNLCAGGAFDAIQTALLQTSSNFSCSLTQSPHQFVHEFYTLLAVTDAKAYAIMQFSWMLLRLYGKGNYTTESDLTRSQFEHRIFEKASAARSSLSKLSTWIWNCDDNLSSSNELREEKHIQFTEVLQGYIVNEVDLNQDNTCKESCSAYTTAQEKGCFGNQFCSHSRRCSKGRLYNCGFTEADSTVCTTNAPGRRYDWVEYKSGRLYGQKKTECSQAGQEKHRVDSWWRWLFWHCSYCTCLCDEPSLQSDRYVSLQSSLASTESNRLVTGVRFVKQDRIVHVQIQDGEALPRGLVNKSTISWRPVTPVSIPKYRENSFEDGPGYATLRYEERTLDLDDLVAPDGHVITGLRFRKLGGHLNLEIQVSPIDFSTGFIDAERTTWLANDNTPYAENKPRTKIVLESPDVPTRSPLASVPQSTSDQYIEFQASSLEKDLGQTTVPFLDATPVSASPSSWLSGIGIYHKGQPGYGGYLAFRVSTFNITDFIKILSNDFPLSVEEVNK